MTTFSSEARTSASPLSHDTLRVADEPFGWADGEEVRRYTLTNSHGMRVRLLNYGGIVQTIEVPDREGRPSNVVLGFSTLDDYRRYNPAPNQVNPQGANVYFGALIGRYANPIGDGIFTLDGTTVRIPKNMEWHAMHGGTVGFDQKVWRATLASTAETAGVRLAYASPAGEMGFPGTLEVTATYSLDEDNRLTLSFEAVTDATTVLNLTNHTYWNLAGEGSGSIYDHLLQIDADGYNPITPHEVPTGKIAPVAGTPFDFTRPVAIGERIRTADDQLLIGHGYDHNYALRQSEPGALRRAARVTEASSGRVLEVCTTQPGLQLYTGNGLQGTLVGTGGGIYRQGDGLALEAQHFPDAPNHPHFASARLDPGDVFRETVSFRLSVEG
jgi:aldose 1-epimerase